MDVAKWRKIALVLAWVSVLWNAGEGAASFVVGISNQQLELMTQGGQSIVEVLSAILVLWRLRAQAALTDERQILERERYGVRAIGFLFVILVLLVVCAAVDRFVQRVEPASTWPGLILSSIEMAAMLCLWRLKRRTALELHSATLEEDAECTCNCAKIGFAIFVGSLVWFLQPAITAACLSTWCNFWWLDSALSLLIAAFIFKDGVSAIRASYDPNFDGNRCN